MLIKTYCFICGRKVASIVCNDCLKRVEPLSFYDNRCLVCSKPVYSHDKMCENCRGKNFFFERNISLFSYRDDIVKSLVKIFKFDAVKKAGVILVELLREEFMKNLSKFDYDILTFVPSSKDSLKERGFDPLDFILDSLKIDRIRLLGRHKHLKKQSEMSIEERKNFIKTQFYFVKNTDISGKKIVIVDDIFTTGNTLNEISRLLLENGALKINTLTFFRD